MKYKKYDNYDAINIEANLDKKVVKSKI